MQHINLNALEHNLNCVRKFAPNSKVIAMVKGNAYGHGLVRVAKVLQDVEAFGVALVREAQILRQEAITNNIIIAGGFFTEEQLKEIIRLRCESVISRIEQIEMLEHIQVSAPLKVWLKINTGMNRLGVMPERTDELYQRLEQCKNVLQPVRFMTHFSDADNPNNPKTLNQIALFNSVTRHYAEEKSLANSAGIIAYPQSHAHYVRPGVMLYGVSPLKDTTGKHYDLIPAMTLESRISAIYQKSKNDFIGYNSTFCCPENMPIGIVQIGYADGYPFHAKSGTPILINDKICHLVGRVSMDMITVDLRNCLDAKVGDTVILWGNDLPVEQIAKQATTIPYELLCRLSKRTNSATFDYCG